MKRKKAKAKKRRSTVAGVHKLAQVPALEREQDVNTMESLLRMLELSKRYTQEFGS